MALIKCSECGDKVSTKAMACPHCGAPVEGRAAPATRPKKKGLFGFLSGNHPIGSKKNPIVISGANPLEAVSLEYKWIEDRYGPEGNAWHQVARTWESYWGKELYRIRIKLSGPSPLPNQPANSTLDIWFDLTGCLKD
tara:strand:+ start:340 stop:753 length:414 start_codon:yes stop_codon:yes gene_type:complete